MHRFYALLELACMRGAHVMLALAIVFTRKRLTATPPQASTSRPFSWHDLDQRN